MEYKTYHISRSILDVLQYQVNFDKLQKSIVPDVFIFDQKCFVPVGSMSSHEKGVIHVAAHEIIPIEKYTGDVEPLFEAEHYNLVLEGKRKRGYHARKLLKGKQVFVMIDPMIYFEPVEQGKQLEFLLQ